MDHFEDLGEVELGGEDDGGGGGCGCWCWCWVCGGFWLRGGTGERDEVGAGRVPAVEHVGTREWVVCWGRVGSSEHDGLGFWLGVQPFRVPVDAEAIRRACKEQDEERSDLRRRVEEVEPCDVGEAGVHAGGCEQTGESLSDMGELVGDEGVWVYAPGARAGRRARRRW